MVTVYAGAFNSANGGFFSVITHRLFFFCEGMFAAIIYNTRQSVGSSPSFALFSSSLNPVLLNSPVSDINTSILILGYKKIRAYIIVP